MLKLFLLLIMLIISSCENMVDIPKTNIENYTCTDEQLKLVDKETKICMDTGYFSEACFKQAKISQCAYNNKIN